MQVDFGVLIAIDIMSVVILSIILSSCLIEYKNAVTKPIYFVSMLAFEILFLVFNAFQYDTERTIVVTGSLSLKGRYVAMKIGRAHV